MSEVYKIQINDSEPIEVSQQVYEVSFCFNEMLKEKDKEIERLNREIRGLNNCVIEFHSEFCNKQAEINRLNNIINELEKCIDARIIRTKKEPIREKERNRILYNLAYILDKLQELKEGEKSEKN